MSSFLLVKLVSHDAHEYNFVPFIWSKKMRPILCFALSIKSPFRFVQNHLNFSFLNIVRTNKFVWRKEEKFSSLSTQNKFPFTLKYAWDVRSGVPITMKLSRLLSLCLCTPFSHCSHKYYCFFRLLFVVVALTLSRLNCVYVVLFPLHFVFNVIIVTCSSFSLSVYLPYWNVHVCMCVCVSVSAFNTMFEWMCARSARYQHSHVHVCLCVLPTSVWTMFIISAVFSRQSTAKLTTHHIIWIRCISCCCIH